MPLSSQPHAAAAVAVLALAALLPAVRAALPAAHRAAMMDIFTATGGASWTRNVGWLGGLTNTEDPCVARWVGVTCDETFSKLQ
jgi:hypothetical protein